MTEPHSVNGVPDELLDAALSIPWGMGFSHLRRQIAAIMPLHERTVRAKVAEEILSIRQGFLEDDHSTASQRTWITYEAVASAIRGES